MIKSIILAAGKGTRMKSDTPKVLHTIFDKTLLGYVIDAVNNTGLADENFVIVGHQADKVEEFVTSNYNNARCILQSPQLGTGHAVSMALPYLNDFCGEITSKARLSAFSTINIYMLKCLKTEFLLDAQR